MMRRRMVGRSVARVAVGTAVVAGTAGAVHHHQDQKYANQAAQQQELPRTNSRQLTSKASPTRRLQQQAAPPPAPAPQAAPAGTDLTSQLNQLSQLHNAGVLSDAEFAQAKQKLLSGG